MAAFTERKQAPHDMVAGALVMKGEAPFKGSRGGLASPSAATVGRMS
ncbi:MAG: hypothetical protein ACRDG8_07015 [Actinomycetota bacterium]